MLSNHLTLRISFFITSSFHDFALIHINPITVNAKNTIMKPASTSPVDASKILRMVAKNEDTPSETFNPNLDKITRNNTKGTNNKKTAVDIGLILLTNCSI